MQTSLNVTASAVAPPSFMGMDWLLVVNLTLATLGFLVFSFAARQTWAHWFRDMREVQGGDRRGSAAELVRRMVGLMLTGATLRALSDALALYGWDPASRSSGGWATAGRFLDPIGLTLMIAAAVIWLLTQSGVMGQLRVQPLFKPIWEQREVMIRVGLFTFLALVMALCPVLFR